MKMGFIKNYDALAKTPQRKVVLDLIEEGLDAIQPEKVINQEIKLQDKKLIIKGAEIDLTNFQNLYLIGLGKGSAHICKVVEQILDGSLTEGYVIDVNTENFSKIQSAVGTHPLPSQTNVDFTKKVVGRFEGKVTDKDLFLVIVCGGGSALFELPNNITIDELIDKNNQLLRSGFTISQMNEERKKFSRVKAGGLARILQPAKVLGLIFSDVPGNDISVVASGPTDDAAATNFLILSNETALNAMDKKAKSLGIPTIIYSNSFQSDAKNAGKTLIEACPSGSILLAGGETTVKVTGNGTGGRNLEVVLNTLSTIDGSAIASFDSDGWDNCEAAGAIGDALTVKTANDQTLNPQDYLQVNNSLPFFQKTADAIMTGRLPSNVSDLFIVYKS